VPSLRDSPLNPYLPGTSVPGYRLFRPYGLGYHLKTGHTLSLQNRPTGLAEDVIVLPCRSVRLQGLGLSPRGGVCYCGFTLPGSRLAE
jgi:hypothetical protein